MKKNLAIIFIIFTIFTQLFSWDENLQIHGAATSADGEWNAISLLKNNLREESIWVYRSDAFWSEPICLKTFNIQNGWATPSVCFDKNNGALIVYHHCWTPKKYDGGVYVFPLTDGRYHASKFTNLSVLDYNLNSGKLYSNKTGVYLLAIQGKWTGKENRNCRLVKISQDENQLNLYYPEVLKEKDFAHLDWREENNPPKNRNVFRDICFATDYGLILLDADESTWWHFDCISENLKSFSTKEAAYIYDAHLERKKDFRDFTKENHLCFYLILICCILISSLIIIIFQLKKIRDIKSKQTTLESLDTKEKNRFIFDIQEKERSKISRDIHDSVVQDIRVIRLETENLHVEEESIKLQNKIEDIATDCILKLRNICYNLAPAELVSHKEGDSSKIELISIINSLAQQFSSRTHVPCTVGVEDDFEYPSLEKEITQNLFRVIQEALTNIEKHSYATKTSIYIKRENSNIVIYITDDGIGCDSETIENSLKSKEHLGLRSMKDRIDLIGGKIEFNSSKDDGMEVKIELGLKQ